MLSLKLEAGIANFMTPWD